MSFIDNITEWLTSKGWIYILVLIIGILIGKVI